MFILEILVIFILIFCNGFFAMSEMAIISARKTRLRQLAKKGNRRAEHALQLAKDPSDFLSTIQTGITLIGIIAGAFGGSTLAEKLGVVFARSPWLSPYSQFLSVTIVVVGITFFSIVLGELVPKRIALTKPEKIAVKVAGPIRLLLKIGYPFVQLLSRSTHVVFRLLRIREPHEPAITQEDIKLLIEQGTMAGVIESSEQAIIERALHLGTRPISSIMTPRNRIMWFRTTDTTDVLRRKLIESDRSVFPVLGMREDEVLGVVATKDVLSHLLFEQELHLETLVEQPLYLPEETPALKVIERFKRSELTVALVIDEHGSIQGLVTMTDIVETLIGELATTTEPLLQQQKDNTWLIDGMVWIDEFKKTFQLNELPEEHKGYYHSVGGFIMSHLGRIPKVNDSFVWQDVSLTVQTMEGRRVEKVLVKRV